MRYKTIHKFKPLGFLKDIVFSPRRDDGTTYWNRKDYIVWLYRSYFKKWLKSPFKCKLGYHEITHKSDIGHGMKADGRIDVWCMRCDMGLDVPIDDLPEELRKRYKKLCSIINGGNNE